MSNQPALKDDDSHVILDPSISLKQFPPKLRKLGKYLLTNNRPDTIKEACEAIGVKYGSIREFIRQSKKKGNNFHDFINTVSDEYLNENLLAVDISTVNGAVSGSHQDRKLYYERIGKLKDTANININHLTIGVNIGGITVQDTRGKGVIDVEPIIPKK